MFITKVTYEATTRRFVVNEPCSYAELWDIVAKRFELPETATGALRYTDPDGDLISLSTDEELKEALQLISNADPPLLRMQLALDQKSATAASPSSWCGALSADKTGGDAASEDSAVLVDGEDKDESEAAEEEAAREAERKAAEEATMKAAEEEAAKKAAEEEAAKKAAEEEAAKKAAEEEAAKQAAEEEAAKQAAEEAAKAAEEAAKKAAEEEAAKKAAEEEANRRAAIELARQLEEEEKLQAEEERARKLAEEAARKAEEEERKRQEEEEREMLRREEEEKRRLEEVQRKLEEDRLQAAAALAREEERKRMEQAEQMKLEEERRRRMEEEARVEKEEEERRRKEEERMLEAAERRDRLEIALAQAEEEARMKAFQLYEMGCSLPQLRALFAPAILAHVQTPADAHSPSAAAAPVVDWAAARAELQVPAGSAEAEEEAAGAAPEEAFPSPTQSARVAAAGELAAKLTAFYWEHNRANVDKVRDVVAEFGRKADGEARLNRELRRKYGADLSSLPPLLDSVTEQLVAPVAPSVEPAPAPEEAAAAGGEEEAAGSAEERAALATLAGMGFDDEERLRVLLAANDNDVQRVLNDLLQ